MSNIFFETDSKCGCFTITQPCRNECICVRDARNAKINDTFVHSKCPILVTFKTDCGVIFIFYSRMYMDVVGRNIHWPESSGLSNVVDFWLATLPIALPPKFFLHFSLN